VQQPNFFKTSKNKNKMKKLLGLSIFLLAALVSFGQDLSKDVNYHYLLTPKPGKRAEDLKPFMEQRDVKMLKHLDKVNVYIVEHKGNRKNFEKRAKDSGQFLIVELDSAYTIQRDYIPNDPQFGSQWNWRSSTDRDIDADEAWDLLSTTNQPTVVAVFDGGVELLHEDLFSNLVTPFNAVTNTASNGAFVNLDDKHGTACTGMIAAINNNSIGIAGIGNNKVKVLAVNIMSAVFAGGSFSTTSAIQINAVNAAIAQGCSAISMSYGGSTYSATLEQAFQTAKTQARGGKGMVICASTGNGSSGTSQQYPAWYSNVYGIGATTSSDLRASFSNFGNVVDISGPGASVLSTDRNGSAGYNTSSNYATVSGTSFSCPLVAGAAGLIAYQNPNLTESQIWQILATTADKVGGYTYALNSSWPLSTRSVELGYGRINLRAAIQAAGSGTTPPPTVHNILISNCSVSNANPLIGSTVTFNVTQGTSAPTAAAVAPKLQYRLSNDNVWSTDDVILGSDTSFVGGGVTNQTENITFNVGTAAGTKYILARVNFDGAVTETASGDNTCAVAINITNPGSAGTDAQVFWLLPSVTTCNNSVSIGYRFKNVGTTTITAMTWRVTWEVCPNGEPGIPSYYTCTNNWNSTQLGGFNIAPGGMSNPIYHGVCLANCTGINTTYNVFQNGQTRVRKVEILTVNGVADGSTANNTALLPITKIACTTATSTDGVELYEEPKLKFYTITGRPIRGVKTIEELPSGMYIIHMIYKDRTEVTKFAK
jgi:subtilisin family serine protease